MTVQGSSWNVLNKKIVARDSHPHDPRNLDDSKETEVKDNQHLLS